MTRALVVLLLAGCAGQALRPSPTGGEGSLLGTAALDEHGASGALIERWALIARTAGKNDALLALHAIDRIDAIVQEGVADEVARAALSKLAAAPLGTEAQRRVAMSRAHLARLLGDDAGVRAFEHEAGCGLPWRAGAMLGRLSRLDLTRAPGEAIADARLTPVRQRGCRLVALTPDGRPAAVPLVLDLSLERAGVVELTTASEAPYQLSVDGVAAPAPDGRAPLVRLRRWRVALAAGRHRLVITAAASYGRTELEVAVLAPGLGLRTDAISGPISDGKPTITVAPSPSCNAKRPQLEALYLEAASAARDGDSARARVAVSRLVERSPKLGVALALAARIAADDSSVPARLARDRARRLYERALEADPAMARARFEAGKLALQRDRAREAVDLAEGAPDRRELWAAILLGDVLRARSRDAEVRPALDAVPPSLAQACSLVDARSADDRLRHRPLVLEAARRLTRCRLGATALGDALRQGGELDAAIAEYRRVIAADPMAESARVALGETLQQKGDVAAAVTTFGELVSIAPRAGTYRLRLVDALIAAGRNADAQRALDDGIAADPENAELAAAQRTLGRGVDPATEVDLDRIDGRQLIADFEKRKPRYDGPAVFLLDRTVTRVYRNGAQRTITHNLIKVQAKEGIDRWGEWHIPQGAEVLTLCAWKPDGSRLEPEEVPEKESISIPGLAAGDYVEVEYLERQPPPGAFIDGFLAERFYFASFEAPLDRSEYTIVAPIDLPVVVDVRGAAPKLEQSTRKEGRREVAIRRYVAQRVPQRFPEPGAVPEAEFLPSVRASARVARDTWRNYLVDLGWASRRRDPALDTLALELTKGDKDERQKLRHLDAWVRKNIQPGGALDEQATAVLARRAGNRVTILAALAEAAGMKARVLLGRSSRSPAIEDQLEGYTESLVEIAGVVIDPRYQHGLPGELPAYLRGQRALVLEPGSDAVATLPATSTDTREMRVAMTLRPDGGGRVEVEERLRGWPALEWRESLEKLAADRVRPQFEQRTLGYFFPGAALDKLEWENADKDDEAFIVRYSMDAPQLARRLGDALVLAAPFSAQLTKRYTTGRPRTSPIYIDEVSPTDLELSVTLPAGARALVAPEVKREERVGRFEQKTWLDGAVLKMRSRFFLPTQRIALDAWPGFLAWVTAVDRAEAAIAQVALSATSAGGSR